MSKSLQPGSFLLGALTLGACLFLTSSRVAEDCHLRSLLVQTAPQPRDHVRLLEGTPYQVPTGKVLTLKAYGIDGSLMGVNTQVRVEVDGQPVGRLSTGNGEIREIPFGITTGEGSTVEIVKISTSAADLMVVYGYLSDA